MPRNLMERKGGFLYILLLLILGLSFLLSAAAVPSSRSLKSVTEHLSTQDSFAQGKEDFTVHEEERRLLVETTDYSEPGSNTNHDPPPSRKA